MKKRVQLGPFAVDEKIGAGGMSVVYRGRHERAGLPVAVKVVPAATGETERRWFREEVQAHASLVHPGIVYLFEHGRCGMDAAEMLGEDVGPKSPYVAMEFADYGTVRDRLPVPDWPTARQVLLQILDALAHAHARNVIHRDLKPENFLIFERRNASEIDWRIKLADFGVAHALGREDDSHHDKLNHIVGTPRYMSPEQLRGHWREYGPWTDLYAIGCIAWELVCGRPPFCGESTLAVVAMQESAGRPELSPQFPVPQELAGWIRRAMAVEPGKRFQRAADAAWALPSAEVDRWHGDGSAPDRRPGEESSERPETHLEVGRSGPDAETELLPDAGTATLTELVEVAERAGEKEGGCLDEYVRDEEPLEGRDVGSEPELNPVERPAVPSSWERPELEPLPMPLAGAGLGLFGLREPPFVNRHSECDRLWHRLQRVIEEQTQEWVIIRGQAGTGKSRLAQRVATRAHEVGAVQVLRASHSAGGGPGEGLRGALQHTFRTARLTRAEVYDHLLARLEKEAGSEAEAVVRDARALTEYLRPTEDGAEPLEGPQYRFESAREKRALILRVLRRLARRRPILLWLDDLHWGAESLGLLQYLHQRSTDAFPLFVVGTLRSDLVAERPAVRRRVERLEAIDEGEWMDLVALSRDHQREFIDAVLSLDDELAERLAERTEGRPLFAIQLLAHWSEEEMLESGEEGFRLRDDAAGEIPENIHALWVTRVDNIAVGFANRDNSEVLQVMELAAALGREIDEAEWRAVLTDSESAFASDLVGRLVGRGLAEWTDDGWAFTHGLFVESLERRAREEDRWEGHHRRCAEMLQARLEPDSPGAWERVADHWVEADEPERALEPLKEAAQEAKSMWNYPRLSAILGRRREVLDAVGVSPSDPRRIENTIEFAWSKMHLWTSPEQVIEQLNGARQRAVARGNARLVARAWKNLARSHRQTGAFERARHCGRLAARHAELAGDREELAWALGQLGWAEYHRGNLDAAEGWFSETRMVAGEAELEALVRACDYPEAVIALARGEIDRASEMFESLWSVYRETRNYLIMFYVLTGRAEIARFRGDLQVARAVVDRQEQLVWRRSLGPECLVQVFLNSSFVELASGAFDEAAEDLEEAEEHAERTPHFPEHYHPSLKDLRLARLAWAAGVGAWERYDEWFERVPSLFPDDTGLKRNYAWLLEMAAGYCRSANQGERARRADELARDLRAALDRSG